MHMLSPPSSVVVTSRKLPIYEWNWKFYKTVNKQDGWKTINFHELSTFRVGRYSSLTKHQFHVYFFKSSHFDIVLQLPSYFEYTINTVFMVKLYPIFCYHLYLINHQCVCSSFSLSLSLVLPKMIFRELIVQCAKCS